MELEEEAGCGWEDEESEKENRPTRAGEAGVLQAKQVRVDCGEDFDGMHWLPCCGVHMPAMRFQTP